VFEVAKGAADGQNRVFQVSQAPAAQYPIHIFRNGLELTPGSDFSIQATYITLAGRVIESPGDVIQAAYMVQTSADRTLQKSSPTLQERGAVNDLLDRFLDRALRQQLDAYPSIQPDTTLHVGDSTGAQVAIPAVTDKAKSTVATSQVHRKVVPSGYASLRMLSQSLSQPAKGLDEQRNERRHSYETSAIAEGTDGLGDGLAFSPLDSVDASPDRTVSTEEFKSGSKVERPMKSKHHSMPSLRMLQRSLQDGK
jgi:hypothetical protein